MNATYRHITVLLEEAVSALAPREDGCYLDGTFGRGGHSRALLEKLGAGGRLLGFDKDPQAIQTGKALAAEDGRFVIVQRSFAELGDEVRARGLEGGSMASCSTLACRRRNSTIPSAASASSTMVRWTCA